MEPALLVIPGDQSSPEREAGTERFLAALARPSIRFAGAPYSPGAVGRQLAALAGRPVVVVAFSAGVVGAAGALTGGRLRKLGVQVEALIALDGWLVPLFFKSFAVYRVSHDQFTHDTSLPLGSGPLNFYADPAVAHLDLWARPDEATGWRVNGRERTQTTALAFLNACLETHGLP